MASWYVRANGKVHGPFEASHLRQMAASGRMSRAMDVSTSSNGPWRKAGSVPGLFVTTAVGAPPPGSVGRAHDGAEGVAGEAKATDLSAPQAPTLPPPGPAAPPRSRWGLLIGGLVAGLALLVAVAAIPIVWWFHGRTKHDGKPARDVAVTKESRPVDSEVDGDEVAADAAEEPRADVVKPHSDETYVCFDAQHVRSHYNLKEEDVGRIQLWNYGEIEAIEVEHRQDERAGEVRDGQVVARNADTEVRKPVRIPHLTPGVVTSIENGVWVDFGEVQIHFSGSESPCRPGLENLFSGNARAKLVPDEGQDACGTVNAVEDDRWGGFDVKVVTRDEEGKEKTEYWRCHLQNKPKTSPFLVYRGGSRSDRSQVEEMPEKRATGRTIE